MGVADPYVAFCIDEAVWMWGRHVEFSLEEATEGTKTKAQASGKKQMVIARLFNEVSEEGEKKGPSGFRDPAMMIGG